LDPDYRLNDSENIFSQVQGSDQIAFNTIFLAERWNSECIDCRWTHRPIWQNIDYTKENYRKKLETFSELEAAFMHGACEYKHPLLEKYQDLFPVWEKASPEIL